MKRFIITFIAVLCCISSFAENFTVDGIKYSTTGSNTVMVVANDYSGDVIIPATVVHDTKYNVTGIGDNAFYGCSGLTSITIPEGVTSIGRWTFGSCDGLTSITIPESVKSIGEYAFDRCGGLTSITILSSDASIGDDAFRYCVVTSFNVDNSLNAKENDYWGAKICNGQGLAIENNTVTACAKWVTSATIPEGVTSIGASAFMYCSDLTSITIPSSVTSIGEMAFYLCQNLTSITIPNSVKSIEYEVFYGCSGLTSLIIPKNVERIGGYAFLGCGFKYLVFLAENPPRLDDEIFDEIPEDIVIYVPNDNYKNWGGFTNIIGLGDYKLNASNEIDAAMNGVTLTEADKGAISVYKDQINSASDFAAVIAAKEAALAIINLQKAKDDALAEINNEMKGMTTLTDADIQLINSHKANINEATTGDVINQNKEAALAIINLQKAKDDALAEIQKEMKGATGSAKLNGLVAEDVNAINAATDVNTISSNKESAINKIKAVIDIYKAGASETLGEMGEEKTNCPAVKVTKGDKVVILYAPEKVEMIKVSENK